MRTIPALLHCDGCTDAITYQRNVALLAFGKATIDLVTLAFVPGVSVVDVAAAWLNPFRLIGPWLDGTMPTMIWATPCCFSSPRWCGTVSTGRATQDGSISLDCSPLCLS